MNTDIAIRVEGLGKKYLIGHEAGRERYTALRDVIGRTAKNWVRTATDVLRGRAIVTGDTTEEFWALKDINFEIKRGEALGIIGRNGAGKSTLLKVLSRITDPTEGRVEIRGRVSSLLEVGTGFHPELTGRENISLNGAILGMTRAEIRRKFDEIVAFAEIEKFLDTPVKRYSSGMYVRLAFAVAAHLEPEILIVDEVLAVGDAEFQKKCLGRMGEVAQRGRTVLFVSHNMAALRKLCGQALLLTKGRCGELGPSDIVISNYVRQDGAELTTTWSGSSRYKNDFFTPTRLALLEQHVVEVEGILHQHPYHLVIGLAVSSRSGDLIFWTTHRDASDEVMSARDERSVRFRVPLPAQLLNAGDYVVQLSVFLYGDAYNSEHWVIRYQDGPGIDFSIAPSTQGSSFFGLSGRTGVLAPLIKWQIEDDNRAHAPALRPAGEYWL
jgi:lipopolysaccharide transport system ATP-binding protein